MKFENGKEMYDYLKTGQDLYSKKLGIYIFVYNDVDALCSYKLNENEVKEILATKGSSDEYWSTYLKASGSILEDKNYEEYRYSNEEDKRALFLKPSYDFCKKYFKESDWIDTDNVTDSYLLS